MAIACANPNGHFYSPVVDPDEIRAREKQLWPANPQTLGLDFDLEAHRSFARHQIAPHAAEFPFPVAKPSGVPRYFEHNDQFGRADARVLYALIRQWKPSRIIEVGSGFSTLLMAETLRDHPAAGTRLTCIEPYPREFLRRGVPGVAELIQSQVQDVGLDLFAQLGAGDVLFIDSSHVSKTGSDVLFLFFEVLPRLRPGVRVHVHDIFLPFEYPRRWVIDENRSWNEQYLLRALLMFSTRFRMLFGNAFAVAAMPNDLGSALGLDPREIYSAGSLWIEVLG